MFKPGDSFVGYHSDTAAAVIMKVSEDQELERDDQVGSNDIYAYDYMTQFANFWL